MNILYTLNSGHPGGMEQHVLDLVYGMSKKGHKVFVWCDDGDIVEWYKSAGATVTKARVKWDIDPIYIFKLTKFLIVNKIDVLHAHELKAVVNTLLAGFLARTSVRISHTHTPISEWKINEIKKRANVIGYSFIVNLLATKEIALTDSRKRVKINEGIKEYKLEVIPNGLKLEDFIISDSKKEKYKKEIIKKYMLPDNALFFGNIGRLTVEKDVSTIVSAYALLLERAHISDNLYLLLAGGGALENEIKRQVSALGIKDKVTITGRFPEEDRVKLYATLDFFIFSSLAEGFGIVLIEALASGLPVISSNLEVLEEVGGSAVFSYFEAGDPQNLSEKMYELYSKRLKLNRVTQNAVDRVRKLYSIEKFEDSYESMYRNQLGL